MKSVAEISPKRPCSCSLTSLSIEWPHCMKGLVSCTGRTCHICRACRPFNTQKLLYRDIKPENLLMGMGKTKSTLHMVDLGLAKMFIDKVSHQHIKPRRIRKSLTGTARFTQFLFVLKLIVPMKKSAPVEVGMPQLMPIMVRTNQEEMIWSLLAM